MGALLLEDLHRSCETMSEQLSPADRERAYQMLGVTNQELAEIEKAPFRQGEEKLRKLQARVRKTFKRLALEYHPDQNRGDPDRGVIFSLLVRASKELQARRAKADPPGVDPRRSTQGPVPWRVNTATVPSQGTRTVIRANVRRPKAGRPDPHEQATRLGKMRP